MSEEMGSLVIVEDDARFSETLATEFRDRGYEVAQVDSLAALRDLMPRTEIDYAVVDLRLRQDSGLDAISIIKERSPEARVVVLTGYGSIATAVQATKRGATTYLTKPVDAAEVERALLTDEEAEETQPTAQQFQSLDRHTREYIEYVLAESGGNISQAARRLGLHRQSLQRKLRKFTPR